jgi:hypothetical protein
VSSLIFQLWSHAYLYTSKEAARSKIASTKYPRLAQPKTYAAMRARQRSKRNRSSNRKPADVESAVSDRSASPSPDTPHPGPGQPHHHTHLEVPGASVISHDYATHVVEGEGASPVNGEHNSDNLDLMSPSDKKQDDASMTSVESEEEEKPVLTIAGALTVLAAVTVVRRAAVTLSIPVPRSLIVRDDCKSIVSSWL